MTFADVYTQALHITPFPSKKPSRKPQEHPGNTVLNSQSWTKNVTTPFPIAMLACLPVPALVCVDWSLSRHAVLNPVKPSRLNGIPLLSCLPSSSLLHLQPLLFNICLQHPSGKSHCPSVVVTCHSLPHRGAPRARLSRASIMILPFSSVSAMYCNTNAAQSISPKTKRALSYPQTLAGCLSTHMLLISTCSDAQECRAEGQYMAVQWQGKQSKPAEEHVSGRCRAEDICRAEWGGAGNKCRSSKDLVIDPLLQKVLVRPEPAVSGGQLLLQARWGQLI